MWRRDYNETQPHNVFRYRLPDPAVTVVAILLVSELTIGGMSELKRLKRNWR